jgi:hypothetical protein
MNGLMGLLPMLMQQGGDGESGGDPMGGLASMFGGSAGMGMMGGLLPMLMMRRQEEEERRRRAQMPQQPAQSAPLPGLLGG